MSRQSRVDGLSGAIALLDQSIPEAARDELAVEMGILGREVLAAQRADVARDTGSTAQALTLQLLVERLKVRIGLIRGSSSRGSRNNFVGRLIEFGRKAQTVLVTRRVKRRRIRGNGTESARRVEYLGAKKRRRPRSSPNAGSFIGDPYKLRVRAQGARPFIAQPELQGAAELQLADYWAKVLTRTGADG
jgi:hypothetical protein